MTGCTAGKLRRPVASAGRRRISPSTMRFLPGGRSRRPGVGSASAKITPLKHARMPLVSHYCPPSHLPAVRSAGASTRRGVLLVPAASGTCAARAQVRTRRPGAHARKRAVLMPAAVPVRSGVLRGSRPAFVFPHAGHSPWCAHV